MLLWSFAAAARSIVFGMGHSAKLELGVMAQVVPCLMAIDLYLLNKEGRFLSAS